MSNTPEKVNGGLYKMLIRKTIAQSKTNHDRKDFNRSKEGKHYSDSFQCMNDSL